jgi:uncharacterized membrane protein YkvA (DUF1232 family)
VTKRVTSKTKKPAKKPSRGLAKRPATKGRNAYARHFSERSWWGKVKATLGAVPFLLDALALYYCMADPDTPLPVKASIAAALGYFILPVDAIPDLIPVVGYTDDAGVITGTLGLVNSYVTAEHRRQAKEFLARD